jgi:2-polyprenyl-6-methoxyphenol hydroxylase-like FAD-dependent oxidoreductase
MPTDQFWQPQTNLTIIGDAAHLMPPYAGEGVNMAMQDALELAQCLTNPQFASLQEAIGQYQKQMFERMAKMAQMTLDQTAVMHAPDGLADMLDMFKEHSE